LDDAGKILKEVKVASEPQALLKVLGNPAYRFKRIGLEAGPLSQWLFSALTETELLNCRKPSIAAINGAAVGVGITMTLPMDVRIAAKGAKIGFMASTKRPLRWGELANTPAPWLPEVSKLLTPPETSAPAQKTRPAPVTMIARTLSSASAR
jgi:hypothetical protein